MITFPVNRPGEKLLHSCLLLLFLFTACSGTREGNETFLKTYGGTPYMGSVQVDIILPNGKYAKTDFGKGSAQFVGIGKDKAQLILFGAIKNEKGDAGFAIDGNCEKLSWQCNTDSVHLKIGEQGAIVGIAKRYPQQFNFTGKISDTRLELTTELKTLEKTQRDLPPGTRFVFKYVLRRDRVSAGKTNTPCKRIVWRPQYVGNFDGSGTTVQIPHCAD